MTKGTWVNGKKTLTGRWEYIWHSNNFTIVLDSKDRITGVQRRLTVHGDTPEWGNWKLKRETT